VRSISPTNVKENNNYTMLPSAMLQRAVREYRKYYKALSTLGIMSCDNTYSEDDHISMGYLLNPEYRSDFVVEYELTSISIVKAMKRLTKNANNELPEYRYLTKWFNEKLQIDTVLANGFYTLYKDMLNATQMIEWIESFDRLPTRDEDTGKRPYIEPVYQQYKIYRIAHGYYPISVDDTSYRLHTNLTSLKSELRNALTYDNKPLVSLDLSNSQPYLSLVLFNPQFWIQPTPTPEGFSEFITKIKGVGTSDRPPSKETLPTHKTSIHITDFEQIDNYLARTDIPNSIHNTTPLIIPLINLVISRQYTENEDVKEYCRLASIGKVYERVADKWREAGLKVPEQRSELKGAVFQALFTANQFQAADAALPKRIFKRAFPNVMKLFEIIKRREPKQLPILLQSIESRLFLKVIAKRIKNERPRLPIFTIHDSIVTTEGNEDYVKSVMEQELMNAIGFEPTINIERYSANNLKRIIADKAIEVGELYYQLSTYSKSTGA